MGRTARAVAGLVVVGQNPGMISVIVPVYRNGRTLAELCARVGAALGDRGEYEVILVVDCPPDATAEVAAQVAGADARVKVVELAKNVGQSRAILVGMAHARGEVVVVMDADLQDSPEAIPSLLEELERGDCEVVFATRQNRFAGAGRHVTSVVFKEAMFLLSLGKLPRHAGLFMAIRGESYRQLLADGGADVHLLGLLARKQVRAGSVGVTRGEMKETGYTLRRRAGAAWKAMRTVWNLEKRRKVTRLEVKRTSNVAPVDLPGELPSRGIAGLMWLALAVVVVRTLAGMTWGWHTEDEAWLLQVISRFLGSESLYRDTYLGVTPLCVYMGAVACSILGVQAWVIKLLAGVLHAAAFLLTVHTLRRSGRPVKPWIIALAMAAFPAPISSLYNDLSIVTVLLALSAVIAWQNKPRVSRALFIGLALGLAAGAKQNMGFYAAVVSAAVMLLTPVADKGRRFAHVLIAAATSAAVLAALLLPVMLSGGWRDMVSLCFDKSKYLGTAIGFWFAFGRNWGKVEVLIYPVSLVALLLTVIAVARFRTRQVVTMAAFIAVIGAMFYPRADYHHLMNMLPGIILALWMGIAIFPALGQKIFHWIAAAGSAAMLCAVVATGVQKTTSQQYVFSKLPHARGMLMATAQEKRLTTLAEKLRGQAKPVFIVSTEASCLYLISDLPNPTRCDFPLVNAFRGDDIANIEKMVEKGYIRTVVLQRYFPQREKPTELYDWLREHCRNTGPAVEAYWFTVFRRAGTSAPSRPASATAGSRRSPAEKVR